MIHQRRLLVMNKRIKKKLGNRLNYKSYDRAPNCEVITDRNKYLKRNISLMSFLKCDKMKNQQYDMCPYDSKTSGLAWYVRIHVV